MQDDIALKLKTVRVSRHITQEELGTQIGKSKQWVSELERGNIRLTFKMAIAISAIYGETPDYFLPSKSINNGYFENQTKTG